MMVGEIVPLALLALALLAGGRALAGTLHAGPLRVAQGDSVSCQILNVGKKDVAELFIEAVSDGSSIDGPLTLAPGEALSLTQGVATARTSRDGAGSSSSDRRRTSSARRAS